MLWLFSIRGCLKNFYFQFFSLILGSRASNALTLRYKEERIQNSIFVLQQPLSKGGALCFHTKEGFKGWLTSICFVCCVLLKQLVGEEYEIKEIGSIGMKRTSEAGDRRMENLEYRRKCCTRN